MIIALKTDQPEAEVGIYSDDGHQKSHYTWHAHRELSATLLGVIRDQLAAQEATFADISGIIIFRGPGSFTGLRIGITVANSLAYVLQVPIAGAQSDDWARSGIRRLTAKQNDRLVMPEYGAEAHITPPRK